jgi:hypothetical protein
MPNLDQQLRSCAYAVLSGQKSLDDLELWLAENAWDERTDLAADVDHALADRQAVGDAVVLDALRSVVQTFVLGESAPVMSSTTSRTVEFGEPIVAGNQTITRHWELAGT